MKLRLGMFGCLLMCVLALAISPLDALAAYELVGLKILACGTPGAIAYAQLHVTLVRDGVVDFETTQTADAFGGATVSVPAPVVGDQLHIVITPQNTAISGEVVLEYGGGIERPWTELYPSLDLMANCPDYYDEQRSVWILHYRAGQSY